MTRPCSILRAPPRPARKTCALAIPTCAGSKPGILGQAVAEQRSAIGRIPPRFLICQTTIPHFQRSINTYPNAADDGRGRPRLLRSPNMQPLARTAAFVVRVFSEAIIPTAPHSVAVSKLQRPFLSDRYFYIVVRPLKRREKFGRPVENAHRSTRTDVIPSSRARKDADHKSGGPRYPSCLSTRPRTSKHSDG